MTKYYSADAVHRDICSDDCFLRPSVCPWPERLIMGPHIVHHLMRGDDNDDDDGDDGGDGDGGDGDDGCSSESGLLPSLT